MPALIALLAPHPGSLFCEHHEQFVAHFAEPDPQCNISI
jgi:hypothetical protein